jgi:hypothetical protein
MSNRDEERKLLLDEYKLVQDKIDKFGAFKFIIRGWAMTVTSAIVAAIATATAPSVSALLVIPILLLFWGVEAHEIETQRFLSSRALRIETALLKTGTAPQTASLIAAQVTARQKKTWMLKSLHDLFYVALVLIVGMAFTVRYWRDKGLSLSRTGRPATIGQPADRPIGKPAVVIDRRSLQPAPDAPSPKGDRTEERKRQ